MPVLGCLLVRDGVDPAKSGLEVLAGFCGLKQKLKSIICINVRESVCARDDVIKMTVTKKDCDKHDPMQTAEP